MAGVILGNVSDDASQLGAAAVEAAKSTWGKVVEKGKVIGRLAGGVSLANSIRDILNDDHLTAQQKAAEIFLKHGYSFHNLPDLLRPESGEDIVVVLGDDGIITVINPMWLHDP